MGSGLTIILALVFFGAAIYFYRARKYSADDAAGDDATPIRKDLMDAERVKLNGPGEFAYDIVGESRYQNNLSKIAGPKSVDGAHHKCEATLILEDENPRDKNAVRVDIDGLAVGYLSRQSAIDVRAGMVRRGMPKRDYVCDAVIVGGWDRGGGDSGSFGVKLDISS